MIKNWKSHQDYLHFMHEAKIHFDSSQRARLAGEFAAAREKHWLLNLDPLWGLWSLAIRRLAVQLLTSRRSCAPLCLCWTRDLQALLPG